LNKSSSAAYVPGEILVKFKQNADLIAVNTIHSNISNVKKNSFNELRVHHVKLSSELTVEEAVQLYSDDPNVEYAEPNYIVSINTIPDDTDFNELWGLHNTGQTGGRDDADIDVLEAWDVTVGSRDVLIAVIDTGVAYDHPDISANIWSNSGETDCADGIDNDNNGYIDDYKGWNISSDDDNISGGSHGTPVAGIVGAKGNNGIGVSGINWNVKLMIIKNNFNIDFLIWVNIA